MHKVEKTYWDNSKLKTETPYHNNKLHGVVKWWHENGQPDYEKYYLYDKEVSPEEYRHHELIKELACIK